MYISIPSFLCKEYVNDKLLVQNFINLSFEYKEFYKLEFFSVKETLFMIQSILNYFETLMFDKQYQKSLQSRYSNAIHNHNLLCEHFCLTQFCFLSEALDNSILDYQATIIVPYISCTPIDEVYRDDELDVFNYYPESISELSLDVVVEILMQFYRSVSSNYYMQVPKFMFSFELLESHIKVLKWFYNEEIINERFEHIYSNVIEVFENNINLLSAYRVFNIKHAMYEKNQVLIDINILDNNDISDLVTLQREICFVDKSWWTKQDLIFIENLKLFLTQIYSV